MDDRTLEATDALEPLLEMIQGGETVVITRDGKAIATVTPQPPVDRALALAAAERIRQRRKGVTLGLAPGETIKDLINEGRKY